MVYDWGIFHALISCGGEDPEGAVKEIAAFRKLIPESVFAQDVEVICLSMAGRWDEARKSHAGQPAPNIETPFRGAAADAALVAASTRQAPDLDKARRLTLVKANEGPIALTSAISGLAALGFLDDAFSLAERYEPNATPGISPGLFLFLSGTKNMRADPRFMRLAARIGLVDYWRTSGHWPDFCAQPGLPYDCKVEAAKYVGRPAP